MTNLEQETVSKIWFLVACLQDFKEKPLHNIEVNSTRLVVAKLDEGLFKAYRDQCPHRLSSFKNGQVKKGCLVCPYHGASFNSEGHLTDIPSNCDKQKVPKLKLKEFALHIDDLGFIWLNLGEKPEPFKRTFQDSLQSGMKLFFNYELKTSVLPIIENFVDCSHTNFVHGGLFRGNPETEVEVAVLRRDGNVVITTQGEKKSDALLYKIFNPTNEDTAHIDEYIAPYTVRVVYRLSFFKVTTVSVCTPINSHLTKVKTIVSVEGNVLRYLLKPLLKYYVWKILKQDFVILEEQAKNLTGEHKSRSSFFAFDLPIINIHQTYDAFFSGEALEEKNMSFKMRL